jgi:hypothetical protein
MQPVLRTGRQGESGYPPARGRCSCSLKCSAGDEHTPSAERGWRLDQGARMKAPQVGDEPPGPCLTSGQPRPQRNVPSVLSGEVLGHRGERRIGPDISGAPGGACPHSRGSRGSCMVENARVVVKELDEDVAPEPAQPLALQKTGAAPHAHRIAEPVPGRTGLPRARCPGGAGADLGGVAETHRVDGRGCPRSAPPSVIAFWTRS